MIAWPLDGPVDGLALRAFSLLIAVGLDFALGDPPTKWHPVAWLGSLVAKLEALIRRAPRLDGYLGGGVLAVVTLIVAAGAAFGVSASSHAVSPFAGVAVDALLIWLAVASKTLSAEGREVAATLVRGDLETARSRVSRLVARRTDTLDEAGVSRAAVESMGENVVDGVIAPLFWAAALGPAGAWAHKAASTLDSMVGYRTARYERFGTAGAKLDDVFAWIPARLALAVVPAAAAILNLDASHAWRIGRRDRLSHASPNAAHGEAAFAGALGIALGGPTEYEGGTRENPVIGAGGRIPGVGDITRAAKLVTACALVTAVGAVAVLVALVSR